MPLFDWDCPNCEERMIDEFIHHTKIMDHIQLCPICKTQMVLDPRRRVRKKFVPYVAEHLSRLEGEPVLIDSLAKLRKIEAKHQDQQLHCEAYSYDTKHGQEDYSPPPNPLVDYQSDLKELIRRGRR